VAGAQTSTVGRAGYALRGVVGDRDLTFSALTRLVPSAGADGAPHAEPPVTVVEARRDGALAWTAQLDGTAGPLAMLGDLVIATLGGHGSLGPRVGDAAEPVRGEPGGVVVALDANTGAPRWRLPLHASEWIVVAAAATAPDGVIVGGSFSGSLRVGDHVVSSGGRSDGFVAKLTPTGEVAWLVRMGGAGADAIQGVAARGADVAIAGTFAAGADLLGHALPAFDEKLPFTDGFVAVLDAAGRRRWAATFGGKLPDSVAGVAIDGAGRVVVAANARDVMRVAGIELAALGPSDGLLAWWGPDGSALHATLVGGADFDGLRAITAAGDHVVVGGFYSGTLRLGDRTLTAGGGDGAFLAAFDTRGAVVDQWEVDGEGREEIVALAPIAGGFVAGIAHTAALAIDGAPLPTPADPMSGAVVLVRPVP